MSKKLKQMRNIECVYKLVTFGYVRSLEKTMSKWTIPMAIFYKVFCFVFIRDYFSTHCNDLKLSDDNMTVTKLRQPSYFKNFNDLWNNNAYMDIWFKSNGDEIITWKFQIKEMKWDGSDEIHFIIVSKDNCLNKTAINILFAPNYGISNGGLITKNGKGKINPYSGAAYHVKGDEISIRLDTNQGKIKWSRFGKNEYENMITDIEQSDYIKYKLAISLGSVKNSITLIDFSCFSVV